jgi:hypothetical protein
MSLRNYFVKIYYQNNVAKVPMHRAIPFILPKTLPPAKTDKRTIVAVANSFSSLMQMVLKGVNLTYIKNENNVQLDSVYDLTKYEFIINDILSCGRKQGSYHILFS